MIKISPAILTSEKNEFIQELKIFRPIAEQIDIDINIPNDEFEGNVTFDLASVLDQLSKFPGIYGIHLMVTNPVIFIAQIIDRTEYFTEGSVIYVHQESNLDGVFDINLPEKFRLGISVKAETELNSIGYYNQFDEVQFMTIETGAQGNPFKPEILERVNFLKDNSYEGLVSIDGSVNEKTAEIIKEYPLDRVSVGSYLSRSEDPIKSYKKLDRILNY